MSRFVITVIWLRGALRFSWRQALGIAWRARQSPPTESIVHVRCPRCDWRMGETWDRLA